LFLKIIGLVSKGADVNAKDNRAITALFWASHNGLGEVVKLLLDNGADIEMSTSEGKTALWEASRRGHINIVKMLIEKGANVNVKATIENVELSAVKAAKGMGNTDIVQLLENAGAKE